MHVIILSVVAKSSIDRSQLFNKIASLCAASALDQSISAYRTWQLLTSTRVFYIISGANKKETIASFLSRGT